MAIPDGYTKLAVVGLVDKGSYSESATYSQYNFVLYEGSTYVAMKDNPSKPPKNGTDWHYLAQGITPGIMTTTLAAKTWVEANGMYTYTLTISGLTANQLVVVTNSNGLTAAQIDAFANSCINAKEQKADTIVLQAIHKPPIDLPVTIIVSSEPTSRTIS